MESLRRKLSFIKSLENDIQGIFIAVVQDISISDTKFPKRCDYTKWKLLNCI